MQTIEIKDIFVDIIKKDIKNIHLGVYPPNGRVRVACPIKTQDEAIRLLVISKYTWIKKHIKNFISQPRESTREYVSGESHYLLGNRYILNVINHNKHPKIEIRNKKYIDMYIKEGTSKEKKKEIMHSFYHNQFKKILDKLTMELELNVGVKPLEYRIRTMKTKWGSCNIKNKRIWLNLELIKKDKSYIKYILTHELVHLLERCHNDSFKFHMDRYIPNWRELKEEMRLGMITC